MDQANGKIRLTVIRLHEDELGLLIHALNRNNGLLKSYFVHVTSDGKTVKADVALAH